MYKLVRIEIGSIFFVKYSCIIHNIKSHIKISFFLVGSKQKIVNCLTVCRISTGYGAPK